MPTHLSDKLISWASIIDETTLRQAHATSRANVVAGHVALMPDAHYGIGSTVGSVIPTKNAIIPAAVGVDLGCGMIAVELRASASDLPDDLGPVLSAIARAVPAGVGTAHEYISRRADTWLETHRPASLLTSAQAQKAAAQLGTLGGGNHFVEVCLDERAVVWVVLHSGSRGIGNILATQAIQQSRHLEHNLHARLEDPDLASFLEGTEEFQTYIADMLWAQEYALVNREIMVDRVLRAVTSFLPPAPSTAQRINCHHNFAQREVHQGQELWITRKGAIKADRGDLGVIPGSMGAKSYVVRGRGNSLSWNSCSHGAGRVLGRKEAERRFSASDLRAQMGNVTWLQSRATDLVDEIPAAYKDIDQVMADQTDLVEVLHTLHQVVNYKGV